MREREERRGYDRARQRDALIFARHYLNGTGITSTFTAVTILPAILVVTITADASVSMYGGDCAQFIPKLLATDIRKAVTATIVLYPLIYGLFPRVVRIIMSRRQCLTTCTPHNRNTWKIMRKTFAFKKEKKGHIFFITILHALIYNTFLFIRAVNMYIR